MQKLFSSLKEKQTQQTASFNLQYKSLEESVTVEDDYQEHNKWICVK